MRVLNILGGEEEIEELCVSSYLHNGNYENDELNIFSHSH